MLRLVAYEDGDKDRPIFMFGLSYENIARLRQDMPIDVDLSTMNPATTGRLVIFAGKDEHEMMNQMRPMIGPNTLLHVDPKFGEPGTRTNARPFPDDAS